jgi:CubicO group peptidase (beta-lactamase class C family)
MENIVNRVFTLFLGLSLALTCLVPSAVGQEAVAPEMRAAIAQIDALAAAEFKQNNVGSLTIGVVSGSKLVWSKSYGHADMEQKQPATKDTIYRIGSVTTQFTGLMLLQLVEAGKVRLSDPVEKYFPEVNKIQGRLNGAPPITLIQLATHTSGLDSEPDNAAVYTKGAVSDWEKTLIAALPNTSYIYEPGTRVSYSNIGYAILGAALSRAAKQPYVEYVQQRIFAPLGMSSTSFEPNAQNRAHISKGYAMVGEGTADAKTPEAEHQGRGYKVPNGAVYTTVADLARFIAFELGDIPSGLLKKETLDENFKSLSVLADEETFLAAGYGIGFRFRVQGTRIVYGYAGGVAGYEARADFDRASRTGVILLRNVGGRAIHRSSTALVIRALDALAPAQSK